MTHNTDNVRHLPRLTIDVEAILSRLQTFASKADCPHCGADTFGVVADSARLLAEVDRLYDELVTTRRESANLRAAIHAALNAARDGESDPLAYLRDELAEHDEPQSTDRARGWRP